MSQPENPAAFPLAVDCSPGTRVEHQVGMSLRDYFAAQALIGILAAEAHPESCGINPLSMPSAAAFAVNAYIFADAMLKARAK